MVGIVGKMSNRIGGFSITQKIDNKLIFKVPAGSKILCLECELENEEMLIAERSIIKTPIGFDVYKNLELTVTRSNTSPITIMRGREMFHVECVIAEGNAKFILPKGARVNQTLVPNTGEFSIPSDAKYLIEY